ncbi:hypothetical protein NJI34_07555 [Pseudomonas sp. S 311-6]|nr:hypothetical protein [Pseudomonas sp. S 311-6]
MTFLACPATQTSRHLNWLIIFHAGLFSASNHLVQQPISLPGFHRIGKLSAFPSLFWSPF